jgi:hypothetical protein
MLPVFSVFYVFLSCLGVFYVKLNPKPFYVFLSCRFVLAFFIVFLACLGFGFWVSGVQGFRFAISGMPLLPCDAPLLPCDAPFPSSLQFAVEGCGFSV